MISEYSMLHVDNFYKGLHDANNTDNVATEVITIAQLFLRIKQAK
jgi:hypothetical protein